MADGALTKADASTKGDDKGGDSLENTADYANYFCTYAFLYHQQEMLTDRRRMSSYYNAIHKNSELFKDKVVIDVGAGTGVLAIWAAQAGARKVYAIEATAMAVNARNLVKANGVEGTVTVIQKIMEEVEIPEKVDIIISEWMGYFLLRESMLDSVIYARDKFLNPTGGAMYPSQASILIAMFESEQEVLAKAEEYRGATNSWPSMVDQVHKDYGIDFSCLTEKHEKEQYDYHMQTAQWMEVNESQMISPQATIAEFDILTCTEDDIEGVKETKFELEAAREGLFCGFVGWFDSVFAGSPQSPATETVPLSTSPTLPGTHWGQQVFLVYPPVHVKQGEKILGTIEVMRTKANRRLQDVRFKYELQGKPANHLFHVE
jgi:protein arginine N-methyltransferase 1